MGRGHGVRHGSARRARRSKVCIYTVAVKRAGSCRVRPADRNLMHDHYLQEHRNAWHGACAAPQSVLLGLSAECDALNVCDA